MAENPLGRAEERHIFPDVERRLRIDAQVDCYTEEAANTLRPFLPDGGSIIPHLNRSKWTVAIYAQNADILWDCLLWKYNDSVSKWENYQAQLEQL